MGESQLSELRNARVLLEEARGMTRNLAYHRRARLEAMIGETLDEVDRQIGELRAAEGGQSYGRVLRANGALARTWREPVPRLKPR